MPKKNPVNRDQRQTVALVSETNSEPRRLKVETTPQVGVEIVVTDEVQPPQTEPSIQDSAIPSEESDAPLTVAASADAPTDAAPGCVPVDSAQKSSDLTSKRPQQTPQRFGSYELIWEIYKDALSTTWAATREGIERPLALRIFNARVTDSAQVRSIQKAARKAAELTHANHVTVYENGVGDNGAPYVVTDWVEGDTLAETFIVTKRLDIASFLNIFNQVCEALVEGHSRQLVHGNLSPNKIIIVHSDDGDLETVKLIDFGMPADPVQNAFYLSPEQCLDRNKANERSDIYSLGCIMYESLVGSPPFIGDKVSQASTNYLHELANQYGKETPEHNALKLLDCIIIKCLQKKQSKRFRNVRELMDALRLVNDCICGGSTRKLPPKAEKLLLFRFLDFFDKKIVACMCAYLILGLVSLMYLGELQLQKYIDEAQLANGINLPLATSNWKSALNQAQLSNKPPSLQADLQWELADSLKRQFEEAKNPDSRNAIGEEARKHYEEAYKYFSHGAHYRSYSLMLLRNMAYIWMTGENADAIMEHQLAAEKKVKKLFEQKKYKQCANVAKEYLTKEDDIEIAYYAGWSNNEIGTALPAKDALRYFERAEYYFGESGALRPKSSNLDTCLNDLGYDANAQDTALAMGCRALEEGDLEAASAEFQRGHYTASLFYSSLINLRNVNQVIDRESLTLTNNKNAIQPLEKILEIEQKAYGMNELALAPTLSSLAQCYRNQGENQKAIDTYKRLFTIVPREEQSDSAVTSYVDLLTKTGQRAQARKELVKRVMQNDGTVEPTSALFSRLMQAYAADKLPEEARRAINKVVKIPQPAKLVTYESYYGQPALPTDESSQ